MTYNGTFTFYKRATKPQMVTNGYDYTTSFLESYVNAFGKDCLLYTSQSKVNIFYFIMQYKKTKYRQIVTFSFLFQSTMSIKTRDCRHPQPPVHHNHQN